MIAATLGLTVAVVGTVGLVDVVDVVVEVPITITATTLVDVVVVVSARAAGAPVIATAAIEPASPRVRRMGCRRTFNRTSNGQAVTARMRNVSNNVGSRCEEPVCTRCSAWCVEYLLPFATGNEVNSAILASTQRADHRAPTLPSDRAWRVVGLRNNYGPCTSAWFIEHTIQSFSLVISSPIRHSDVA